MTLRSSDLQSDSDLDSIRNSCNVLLTIRLLVIHILPKAVGRNLVQRRKSNRSKSLLFLPLCLFPGADECEEKRHRSVGLGSVVLVRPEKTSPVERTLSDSTFQSWSPHIFTFLLPLLHSRPSWKEVQRKKKNYFGNNMAEEEVDIDLADPEVILHFSSLTYWPWFLQGTLWTSNTKSSRFFDLLNSMISDLNRSEDLRWLLDLVLHSSL